MVHTTTDFDATTREAALCAVGTANRFLFSARGNLVGHRLPLAGIQYDADKALTELLRAVEAISEAIRLIETSPLSSVEQPAHSRKQSCA